VSVPSSKLAPLAPSPTGVCAPPPPRKLKGGGTTLACGGSQFGRLEIKPGTLSTLSITGIAGRYHSSGEGGGRGGSTDGCKKTVYDLFCFPTEGVGQKDIIMIYQWETGGNQAGIIASGLPANRSHRPHFLLLPLSAGITMSYSSERDRETDKDRRG
jgi:hypothetical protein